MENICQAKTPPMRWGDMSKELTAAESLILKQELGKAYI